MIPASAYVAPSAVLCGAVTLGERVRVLHGAVLTAEDGEIWIGDDVVIMENALVRGRSRHPALIGSPSSSARTLTSTVRRLRTKSSSRPERRCSLDRLQPADRNCESIACCTSTPSWHRRPPCRSAGSPQVIQPNSSAGSARGAVAGAGRARFSRYRVRGAARHATAYDHGPASRLLRGSPRRPDH